MKPLLLILLISSQTIFQVARAAEITTAEILTQTTSALPTCLNWRPVGTCLWLVCSLTGCSITSSLRVAHYSPDLVVPVYNTLTEHPWTDMGAVLSTIQQGALAGILGQLASGMLIGSSGQRTETRVDNDRPGDRQRNVSFRETDAIGHPLLATTAILEAIPGGMLCPSLVTPLLPYFQSALDALVWRNFIPTELIYPASFVLGLREIGTWPLNTWGHVHPRIGFMDHLVEPKAAATHAQRAGDIVTR